jgi:hypothetical protein
MFSFTFGCNAFETKNHYIKLKLRVGNQRPKGGNWIDEILVVDGMVVVVLIPCNHYLKVEIVPFQ